MQTFQHGCLKATHPLAQNPSPIVLYLIILTDSLVLQRALWLHIPWFVFGALGREVNAVYVSPREGILATVMK